MRERNSYLRGEFCGRKEFLFFKMQEKYNNILIMQFYNYILKCFFFLGVDNQALHSFISISIYIYIYHCVNLCNENSLTLAPLQTHTHYGNFKHT